MLDERIEAIRKEYGLAKEDFWQLPQKAGTWLVKHAALEIVAAKAGITFDPPQIIEASTGEGIAVLAVNGYMGDRRDWSTGEASPKNNKNAYPWAMAEKRAKDRVILKLVGIHGLVYSEDEMSEPVSAQAAEPEIIESNPTAKKHFKTVYDDITASKSKKQLAGAWERHQPVIKLLPQPMQDELIARKDEMKEYLDEQEAAAKEGGKPVVAYNFDAIEQGAL